MIEVIGVTKRFGNTTALSAVDCLIPDKSLTVITGASGSGKTTLLMSIGLMIKPTSGTILIDGINYYERGDSDRALLRNKRIGFVFQDYKLDPLYSVYENIELPLLIGGVDRKKRKLRVLDLLDKVNLSEKIYAYPPELSGGQQQRVAIARALANSPDIILADEPCASLDEENRESICRILTLLSKEKTVIVVSHAAWKFGSIDQKLLLHNGKLSKL